MAGLRGQPPSLMVALSPVFSLSAVIGKHCGQIHPVVMVTDNARGQVSPCHFRETSHESVSSLVVVRGTRSKDVVRQKKTGFTAGFRVNVPRCLLLSFLMCFLNLFLLFIYIGLYCRLPYIAYIVCRFEPVS